MGVTMPISKQCLESYGLLPEEYQRIQQHLGREPNPTELAIFGVMWSEHCAYKNSRLLLRQFPTQKADPHAPNRVLVKAGEENAGIVDIDGNWAICFKIESHNHPSAVDPFEGAATGVGGILRDIFTMGARPILLTNSLRFGELDSLTTRRLLRGVVSGISHYGNCVGIPTVGGDTYFDACYEGNLLVNALCLGILKREQIKTGAARGIGNPVYYIGAATGRDGLGGARFASRELDEETAANRPAVQKGDPFMGKLLIEACLELMAVKGLVVGIQDMGAAGLTCSTCETAARAQTGIDIELDCVPQRETRMTPEEILLSESQERMLLIVQKGRESELEAICEKWDLLAVAIGQVTAGNTLQVRHKGQSIAQLPVDLLVDEAPVYKREAQAPAYLEQTRSWDLSALPELSAVEIEAVLPQLLANPTLAHKRWIWQQYDHDVMANTVVGPGSDAAVIRLRLGSDRETFLAIANDGNGCYTYLDPYRGGQIAIAECLRNLACSGARPLAMTNSLNFGNPYKPESFYQLQEAVRGLADACRFFDLPVVGGNVSLYNEHPNGAIDPTPIVAVVGLIEERHRITTQTVKQEGATLILIGGWPCELGGSRYLNVRHRLKKGRAPAVDLAVEQRQNAFLLDRIGQGHIEAAHDVSEGGLLIALVEMLFYDQRTYGATLSINKPHGIRSDALFYGESQGRILIAVRPAVAETLCTAAKQQGIRAQCLGTCTDKPELRIIMQGRRLHWDLVTLRTLWEQTLVNAMKREA